MADKRDNVIDVEITRIYERDGHVKPSVVVAEAKPKEAPLHDHFEWNNARAADQHRLWQARHIIRVARSVHGDGEERFVHVPSVRVEADDEREGHYKPGSVVVESIDEFERAMAQANAKLRAAQAAVHELEKAAGSTGKGDELLARIALAIKSMETARVALLAT